MRGLFRTHSKKEHGWTAFEELRISSGQTLLLALGDEELAGLVRHVGGARVRSCLRLLDHTGLRVGEAVGPLIEDLRNSKPPVPRVLYWGERRQRLFKTRGCGFSLHPKGCLRALTRRRLEAHARETSAITDDRWKRAFPGEEAGGIRLGVRLPVHAEPRWPGNR